jgi:hypothetical protein
VNGKGGEQGRRVDTECKGLRPFCLIVPADIFKAMADCTIRFAGDQTPAQKPRRLNGHTDAFGNDGMGFPGNVAEEENPVRISIVDPGPHWTSSEPCPVKCGAAQHRPNSCTGRSNMFQDRLSGALLPPPAAAQNTALDATGQANSASITVNHPAIAAGKDEQGHQV